MNIERMGRVEREKRDGGSVGGGGKMATAEDEQVGGDSASNQSK